MQTTIVSLEAALVELQHVMAEYGRWNQKTADHGQEQARLCDKVGQLLHRPVAANNDPVALLNDELRAIHDRVQALTSAVRARQERLDVIVGDLEKMHLIREILQLEEKSKILERIQESAKYRKLKELREQAAQHVADVEAIRGSVSATAHQEARTKLAAAETTIDRYFRRLTRHPAVNHFRLAVNPDARTGRNTYELTDQDGRDLVPVLSQGDLNALALAMFLGLACAAEGQAAVGFVLLDDPSQSLGLEHKEHLVAVLNEVAASKNLIVATMDREFRDCWRDGLTTARAEYFFEGWTPSDGPVVSRK
jgi:DNA repair exonuclease SbcCD ATPase subunit